MGENNSNDHDQSSNPTSGEEDTSGRDLKTPGGGTAMKEAQGSNPTNYNSGNGTGSNGNGSNGNGSNSNGNGSNENR